MRIHRLFISVFLLQFVLAFNGQAQIVFTKNYSIKQFQFTTKINQFDGSLYILGDDRLGSTISQGFILKIKLNGDSVSYYLNNDSVRNDFIDMVKINKSFYIVGDVERAYGNYTDAYLYKLNEWDTTHLDRIQLSNGSSAELVLKILASNDNRLYNIGWYDLPSGNTYFSDIYVVKTDTNGNKIWSKTFGGNSTDYPMDALFTNEGNILLTGATYSYITPPLPGGQLRTDAYVVCIDTANGNVLWQKHYNVNNSPVSGESLVSVCKSKTGGFILGGWWYNDSLSTNPLYGGAAWIVKINDTGAVEWQKLFWDLTNPLKNKNWMSTSIKQIAEMKDGGIVFISSSEDTVENQFINKGFICKYNPICDTIVWRYDFGGLNGKFVAQAFTIMPDESIYFVLENAWVNGGDIYLVKIDSTGKMINECLMHPPSFTNNYIPFPNPFTTEFTLQFSEQTDEVNLTMYNAVGQLVVSNTLIPKPTAEGNYYINYSAPTLAKGLYFYKLTTNNKIILKGKIIKQ